MMKVATQITEIRGRVRKGRRKGREGKGKQGKGRGKGFGRQSSSQIDDPKQGILARSLDRIRYYSSFLPEVNG